MMQNDTADDWVLATGETYTVKDFLQEAFSNIDLNWEDYVVTSEKYYRPNEVDFLLGDSSKAKNNLGWENKTSFKELVNKMVESDIDLATQEQVLLENKLISPTWEYPTSNSKSILILYVPFISFGKTFIKINLAFPTKFINQATI